MRVQTTVLGDLNANLINPRDEREDGIAEQVDAMELAGMTVILAGVVMVCWPSEKAPAV